MAKFAQYALAAAEEAIVDSDCLRMNEEERMNTVRRPI